MGNKIILLCNKGNVEKKYNITDYPLALMELFNNMYFNTTAPSIYKSRYLRVSNAWRNIIETNATQHDYLIETILNL